MREIKFRGRAKEPIPDKWFYGGYVRKGKKRTKHYIVNWNEKNMKLVQVDLKSIGQYTGLVDKNGTEIYEGDIIECLREGNGFVTKRHGAYGVETIFGFYPFIEIYGELEVIGNIYEHPHLLGD